MNGRSLGATGVAVIVVLVLCGGLAGALLTGGGPAAAGCYTTTGTRGAPPLPAVTVTPPPEGFRRVDRWDAEQVANAAVILSVGAGKAVPPRGWVVALATAMQESSLVNLPGGDLDSIGLFQQRPSQGWGTPTQLHDPRYATTAFYKQR